MEPAPSSAMNRAKTFGSFGYIRDLYGAADASSGADESDNEEKVEKRAATKDVPITKSQLSLQGSVSLIDPVSPMRRGHCDLQLDTLKARPLQADKAQKLQPMQEPASLAQRSRPQAQDDLLFDFDALEESEKATKTVIAEAKPPQALPMGFGFNTLDVLHTPKAKAAEPTSILPPEEKYNMFDFKAMEATVDVEDSAMESQASTAASEEEATNSTDLNEDIFLRSVSAPPENGRLKQVRVAMVLYGSRGDIEPFVAFAKELVRREFDVRILTNANLVACCEEHGIEAVPVYADTHAVINRCGGFNGYDDTLVMRTAIAHAQAWMRENPDACVAVDNALEDYAPHVTIGSHMGNAACTRYEMKHNVPQVLTYLHTKIFHDNMAIEPVDPPRPSFLAVDSDLVLHGVPPRWQDRITMTRPWQLHQEESPSTMAGLQNLKTFLQKGEKPVAIGWGSMLMKGMSPASMLGLALSTLRGMKRRGIILGGYAGLEAIGQRLLDGTLSQEEKHDLGSSLDAMAAFASTEVCFVASAPYYWLLPQCSAFVTHGGVGSVTAAMRAGCPCVVTPVFGDQFTHSQSIEEKQLGHGFSKPLSDINRGDLIRAIRKAEERKPRCERQRRNMAKQEEDEPGASQAARLLSEFVHTEVITGNFAAKAKKWYETPLTKKTPPSSKQQKTFEPAKDSSHKLTRPILTFKADGPSTPLQKINQDSRHNLSRPVSKADKPSPLLKITQDAFRRAYGRG